MSNSKKITVHIETEPIFGIHIDFMDGSNPVDFYNLSLARALDVLKEWSENYILHPDPKSMLNDSVWRWRACGRNKDYLKELLELGKESEESSEDDEDVEPILEDDLNRED